MSPLARARSLSEWAALFSLTVVVAALAVALVVKVVVVASHGYWPLLPFVLRSWRTMLLFALATLLAIVWGRGVDPPSWRRARAHALRWAVGGGLVLAALWAAMPRIEVNAFGLQVAGGVRRTGWHDVGHPHRPPMFVTTNSYGFRDRERTDRPADGVDRVVVIGDSYVFGSGVQEPGTIHRALEARLAQVAPSRRWEVLNAGNPGWGLATYLEVARRLARALHPRVVVIGSLGWSDWDLLDPQQILDALGPLWFRAVAPLGVVEDLRDASLRYGRELPSANVRSPMGEDHVLEVARGLLDDAAAQGFDVVLWDYYDPTPVIHRLEGHPRFHRAGWPAGFDRRWDGWGMDPVLAIPVDRHPTAEGNRRVAESLAPAVVEAALGASALPAARSP